MYGMRGNEVGWKNRVISDFVIFFLACPFRYSFSAPRRVFSKFVLLNLGAPMTGRPFLICDDFDQCSSHQPTFLIRGRKTELDALRRDTRISRPT